jgi:molybdopterin molybdotransferase
MPEFIDLLPPQEALEKWLASFDSQPVLEEIDTRLARGRVIMQEVLSPHALPTFNRSTVDGYAVRAADTHGASDSMPVYLHLSGEIRMGEAAHFAIDPQQCALIHTGGMLPGNADAVVMLENTQVVRQQEIEVLRSAAAGENVIEIGEDIRSGEVVVEAGKLLRPADIGGLLALGITRVDVAQRPLVGVISSGDEIVPPETEIQTGQIRDINSYSLAALIENAGGNPKNYGVVPDEQEPLEAIAAQAVRECDLVVITAGSSASNRDLTSKVIDNLGSPGVLVHGVNVRPGKPTILAASQTPGNNSKVPVIGLPGNPVSALVIATLFVEPMIEYLMGITGSRNRPQVGAKLAINLASSAGREDWVPVRLEEVAGELVAEPIFGKSNLIFTLSRADGLLHIPAAATGINAGEVAQVRLL